VRACRIVQSPKSQCPKSARWLASTRRVVSLFVGRFDFGLWTLDIGLVLCVGNLRNLGIWRERGPHRSASGGNGMRDTMTHRGPDDEGIVALRRGGAGASVFRRLSIIDLSPAGNQPMHGLQRYRVLARLQRRDLQPRKAPRRTRATRPHLWFAHRLRKRSFISMKRRGLDFVNELEGDYAIGLVGLPIANIWCSRARSHRRQNHSIFLKPNGRFIFASEIKGILQHPGDNARD